MFEHCWLIVLRGKMLRRLGPLYELQIVSHRLLRYASGLLHVAVARHLDRARIPRLVLRRRARRPAAAAARRGGGRRHRPLLRARDLGDASRRSSTTCGAASPPPGRRRRAPASAGAPADGRLPRTGGCLRPLVARRRPARPRRLLAGETLLDWLTRLAVRLGRRLAASCSRSAGRVARPGAADRADRRGRARRARRAGRAAARRAPQPAGRPARRRARGGRRGGDPRRPRRGDRAGDVGRRAQVPPRPPEALAPDRVDRRSVLALGGLQPVRDRDALHAGARARRRLGRGGAARRVSPRSARSRSSASVASSAAPLAGAAVAAFLFVLQGIVTWEATSAFIELGMTFYVVLAVWHGLRWARASGRGALWTGVLSRAPRPARSTSGSSRRRSSLGILAVAALRAAGRRARRSPPAPRSLAGGAWYLKNLIATGNPVYPFVFGGQVADAVREGSDPRRSRRLRRRRRLCRGC